jgi:methylated-DNA-protein-cysteine methyltransferase related protein
VTARGRRRSRQSRPGRRLHETWDLARAAARAGLIRSAAARERREATGSGPPRPRGFDETVYAIVRRVPAGRVVTYGQVAALAGVPRAARAVGQAMHRCPPGVPWHRVVNGQGAISRRPNTGGMVSQRLLLHREGVRFARGRIELGRYGWRAARPRVDVAALESLVARDGREGRR